MSANWFEVDRDGLRKIMEGRGKAWAIFELIQNTWDLDAAKTVKVTIEAIEGVGQVWLTVEDDHPDGFTDLSHAFTLFAESEKKGDPTKRGRFNLGCKLVLAMCHEASVYSTTGQITFDPKNGRHKFPYMKRDAGSRFRGRLSMTRAELADIEGQLYTLLPPPNVITFVRIFNGARWTEAELVSREPEAAFEATLPTDVADEEGVLRRRERKTTVHLYSAANAMLFEMGLPVQPIEGPWSVNVLQKVPLNLDRTAVPPAFVSKLQTLVANHTARDLMPSEFTKPWIAEVVQDKNVSPEIVKLYLGAKYGDKIVIDVPGADGQESGRNAVANGYTVIRGGSEAKETWSKIREHDLAKPATALFPPMKASSDYRTLGDDEITPAYRQLINYCLELAPRVLGCEIIVRIIEGDKLGVLATWGRGGKDPVLTFNKARLPTGFFQYGPDVESNKLIIHEFAHHYGDHLEEAFDDAMALLGAKLTDIALREPAFFAQFVPAYVIPHQPFAHY